MASSTSPMACPKNDRYCDLFLPFAPSRLCVKNSFIESNRSAITAQPNCCEEECRGEYQSDPETGRAQEPSRSELSQRVDRGVALRIVRVESERLRRPTHQTVFNQ